MVTALGSIGRDSIAGLLNGLKSGDADIQNAAKFLGNNLITSLRLSLVSPARQGNSKRLESLPGRVLSKAC
jgi:hypothetical protein